VPASLSIENTVPGAESSAAVTGIAYAGFQADPAQRRSPSGVKRGSAAATGSGISKCPSQIALTFIESLLRR
jgi:hypothetical protein